jgi:hypothetical protein
MALAMEMGTATAATRVMLTAMATDGHFMAGYRLWSPLVCPPCIQNYGYFAVRIFESMESYLTPKTISRQNQKN